MLSCLVTDKEKSAFLCGVLISFPIRFWKENLES